MQRQNQFIVFITLSVALHILLILLLFTIPKTSHIPVTIPQNEMFTKVIFATPQTPVSHLEEKEQEEFARIKAGISQFTDDKQDRSSRVISQSEIVSRETNQPTKHTAESLKQTALESLKKTISKKSTQDNTLLSQTKTSIENLLNEGGSFSLSCTGADDKTPSLAQLKYMSYGQKIMWNLQNAWKTKIIQLLNRPIYGNCQIAFSIDKQGNMQKHEISGDNSFINNIVECQVKFSVPLPPIPDHFSLGSLLIVLRYDFKGDMVRISLTFS